MSAHLLAKLTAHGIQITGEGFGGTVEISESDVAGALAGLDRPVYEFMRLKFCGDSSMLSSVVEGAAWRILGECFTDTRMTPDLAKRLAILVVHRATDGPLCTTCNGTGTHRYKDCKGCSGTGRRELTMNRCATIVEVERKTYIRLWADLVDRQVMELEHYQRTGLRHVVEQFAEPDLVTC